VLRRGYGVYDLKLAIVICIDLFYSDSLSHISGISQQCRYSPIVVIMYITCGMGVQAVITNYSEDDWRVELSRLEAGTFTPLSSRKRLAVDVNQ